MTAQSLKSAEVMKQMQIRKAIEDDFERIFVKNLRSLGIWASVIVPARPLRPLKGSDPARKAVFSNNSLFPKFLLSI